MALVLFAFSLWLNTRHNDFPYSYHPDEEGKTGQIIGGSRNYHHPLLMLSATDIVSRVAFIPRKPQPIVETGRWVIATFAALTVATLALLAWTFYGALVGWATGLAIALQADLFETAHYMKEDPALAFGIALSLLAAAVWWKSPSRRSLRFLAIACGLAVSGKYIGILVLLFALPMILWHRAADAELVRGARLKFFATAFGLTVLVCNLPLFANLANLASPFRSIGHEVEGLAEGHRGITRQIPHGVYLESLRDGVPGIILLFTGIYVLHLIATARRRTPPEWAMLLFPLAYLAVISCSSKIADRYLLPVSVLVPFLAILGVSETARTLDSEKLPTRRMIGYGILVVLAAWVAGSEWPAFRHAYEGYRHDDPKAVAEWVKANLPPDAIIVEDHRVNLSPTKCERRKNKGPSVAAATEKSGNGGLSFDPSKDARVPQTVYSPNFASEVGTLEQLRNNGVTHVAICKSSYGRYFKNETKPRDSVKTGFDRQREFYAEVLETDLVKAWPPGKISYLQPGIKLFRITPPSQ